jgi:hypothetical protein
LQPPPLPNPPERTALPSKAASIIRAKKNDMLRHSVVITANDGYSTVLSLGELAPDFGNEQAIIAYQQADKPIEGANGFARLIIAGDKAAGRAISAISTVEVH